MRKMWHLMGRSVGTYLLIAHWELLISLDAYLVIVLIWDIDILIMLIDYLDWGFWCNVFFVFHCYTHLGHWHADCDDWLSCLSYIVTLILPWLFCSPRMYRLIVVYHLTWCVDSLACISAWSSLSMLSLSLFILIVIACVWTWVIYLYFAWLYGAWLLFSYMIACRLSVCAAHLSLYF